MNKPLCVLLLMAALCPVIAAQARVEFQPITSGYGANGSFTTAFERFPNPLWPVRDVEVFHPAEAQGAAPVIFFAPGFSKTRSEVYSALIRHIVSRGYAVVFTPYQVVSGDPTLHELRYATIYAGFAEAVKRFPQFLDTRRVGFVGHSYGAGALPALALKGASEAGWGREGLFLYPMAPWYYFNISLRQFLSFPSHAKLLVQVYDGDDLCDHRIAREIFDRINLPGSEKDFVMLRSEERMNYRLGAEHGAMYGGDGAEKLDALDYYGVWRLFDALADYTFNGSEAARPIALGNGSREQRFMGLWPDGQPVREMLAGDCVAVTRSSFSFVFPYFPAETDGTTSVSSASFQTTHGLAPDSLATAYGRNLSASAMDSGSAGPQAKLGGTTVRVRDSFCVERTAQLFFVSPTQINYLVPAGTAAGAAIVTVMNEQGAISSGTVQINETAPSLFTASSSGQGVAAALVARLKADGTLSYEAVARYDSALNRFVAAPIEFGPESDQLFLVLYGTGLRHRAGLNLAAAWIGNVYAEPLYIGPQGFFHGLDQVNLRLPRTLAGRGEVDVLLTMDGRNANLVKVSFR
jgi:uncharacterized protein (TIGR03437 family)